MFCLVICSAQTRSLQQKKLKAQRNQQKVLTSLKTSPSIEALTQQFKTLEAKLTQLQTRARKLETSSQRTITTLEKKVSRLGIAPIRRQISPSEAGGDVIGFTKQGNKYTLAVNGTKIEIDAAGSLLLQTPGQLTLESGAILHASGSIIKLGNNPKRPVAGLQDLVVGNQIVTTSSPNVLVE
jgi:hypothetical protein